jgi:lipoprotein-releasing system ATP-binding protein
MNPPSKPLLQTNDLTKVYPGIEPVYAVRNINLEIGQGEFVSIIGPSGSGKSTLMNLLGLLDRPTDGKLLYLGEDAARWGEAQKSQFRNREIGFIFQAHLLLPEFTAVENLLIPMRIGGTYTPRAVRRAETLLERIGLGERKQFKPTELSGGQNQRVAIARALMNNPRIVFADEPTGALDYNTGLAVYDLMREINREESVTFVIVTHERELAQKSDRIISILDGTIQSDELHRPSLQE